MGFFNKRADNDVFSMDNKALDAVYELLCKDNLYMGRKGFDSVEINNDAILVNNWGFDEVEVGRKQQHAISTLVGCGLIVDDHGFMKDNELMGCYEGLVSIPLADNGGAAIIAQVVESYADFMIPADLYVVEDDPSNPMRGQA